jgi:PAS domain S-box-containing protein
LDMFLIRKFMTLQRSSRLFAINLPKVEPIRPDRLRLMYLPAFADFILREKFEEFVRIQFNLTRQMQLPMLKHFSNLSEEAMLQLYRTGISAMLTAIRSGKTAEYFSNAVNSWVNGNLQQISSHQIVSDDITIVSFVRRKAFRDLIPMYISDLTAGLHLIEEVDHFLTEFERILYNTLMSIQGELYERAQSIAHLGNWVWDLSNNSLYWSPELFRIYELVPGEEITMDLASYNHPEDAEMVREEMRKSRETRNSHDFYYRIVLPSGAEKWLHAAGQVLAGEDGTVSKMFGTLQDVTEQRRAEKARRESELFIRKVTDLTPSVIAVYNINTGDYLYINQAIETLLGYSPAEVLKNGINFILALIHPDDLPRIMEENQVAIAELAAVSDPARANEIREFRYRLRHKNGEYRWIQTFGAVFERDRNGMIEKVINISNDISESIANASIIQRQSTEIKRQQDRHFKMIEEVEEYVIILLSPEGIIENWNRGAEKIQGYSSGEVVGKHIRMFYPQGDQDAKLPERLIGEAAIHGRSTHEGWRVRKGGQQFWAYVVITALHDDNGAVIGFSKVTRDLTAKKLAEDMQLSYMEQLKEKNIQLEAKNAELESFAYIASHDLQEPLRKIKIWGERLLDSDDLSVTAKTAAEKMQTAATRMQSLIAGVLKYVQTDGEKTSFTKIDLNVVVREVLEDFSEVLEEKGAVVRLGNLPVLCVIPLQIKQLFSNLISNAAKYSKQEAALQINIGSKIVVAPDGSGKTCWEIEVSDNGIGFAQEQATKVFDIFQRLVGQDIEGTGIGLSICKKIARRHGGDMYARSEPGKGASFFLLLPEKGSEEPCTTN